MSDNQNEQQQINYEKLFNYLTVNISEPISAFETELKGFNRIFEFFRGEFDFWDASEKKGGKLKNYHNHFR